MSDLCFNEIVVYLEKNDVFVQSFPRINESVLAHKVLSSIKPDNFYTFDFLTLTFLENFEQFPQKWYNGN